MSVISTIEQKALFTGTRVLTYIAIIGFVVAFFLSGLAWMQTNSRSYPPRLIPEKLVADLESIGKLQTLKTGQPSKDTIPAIEGLQGLKFGPLLSEIRDRDGGYNTIWSLLEGIDEADRQDFLNGLERTFVLSDARSLNRAPVAEAYVKAFSRDRAAHHAFDQEMNTEKGSALWRAAAAMALIATFSLVLVLLAIERNTRPQGWSA